MGGGDAVLFQKNRLKVPVVGKLDCIDISVTVIFAIKQYEIRTEIGKNTAGAFGTVCETDYGSDPETGLTNVLLAARK